MQIATPCSVILCSCQLSDPFRRPGRSNLVYPANENQACFLLVVLDSRMGPALQLPLLCFPATLAPREICPVSPSLWLRLVFILRAIQPCRTCGSAPPDLRFGVLPKYLSDSAPRSPPPLFREEECE